MTDAPVQGEPPMSLHTEDYFRSSAGPLTVTRQQCPPPATRAKIGPPTGKMGDSGRTGRQGPLTEIMTRGRQLGDTEVSPSLVAGRAAIPGAPEAGRGWSGGWSDRRGGWESRGSDAASSSGGSNLWPVNDQFWVPQDTSDRTTKFKCSFCSLHAGWVGDVWHDVHACSSYGVRICEARKCRDRHQCPSTFRRP